MAGGRVTCKCGRERPFNVTHCPHCTHSTSSGGLLDNLVGAIIFIFIIAVIMAL